MNARLSLITIALLNIQSAYSSPSLLNSDTDYPSRVTGQFLTGSDDQLGGFADTMIPFIQNKDRIYFADGALMAGQYGRLTYSGGLGYRGIQEFQIAKGILGAYVFTDYYQTALNNEYWQLNPGLEWLNERYEARLQAYVPLNDRTQSYASTLASQVPQNIINDSGNNRSALNYVTGHTLFDTPVDLVEQFGPGVELEVGGFFDVGRGLWLRAGGYHFNYQHANNINGVQANAEMAMTKNASLIIQNNYDNQNKNRFSVGIRLNLGGSTAPIGTLEQRMTSPIIRHQARQSYGEALPSRQNFIASGPTFADNGIWFFSPNGTNQLLAPITFANCTAENPCLTIDSNMALQIAGLTPSAKLFFESGSYSLPSNSGSNWTNLRNGQSVWGRDTGWVSAASGANRPLINGGLYWGSTLQLANGAIYDTKVLNSEQQLPTSITNLAGPAVVAVGASGDLYSKNSDITAFDLTHSSSSVRGFLSTTATILNSTFMVNSNSLNGGGFIRGIALRSAGTITNSSVNVEETSFGATDLSIAGILSTGSVDVSNTTINARGINFGSGSGTVSGVATTVNAFVTNSYISAYGKSGANQLLVRGVAANQNAFVSSSIINSSLDSISNVTSFSDGVLSLNFTTVQNSSISTSIRSMGIGQAIASAVEGSNNVTAVNNSITSSAFTTSNGLVQASGIFSVNANVTATGNIISSTSTSEGSGLAQSVGVNAGASASINDSNQITVTANANGTGTADVIGVYANTGILFSGSPSYINLITTPGGTADSSFGSAATNTNNSQCTVNGVTGPC